MKVTVKQLRQLIREAVDLDEIDKQQLVFVDGYAAKIDWYTDRDSWNYERQFPEVIAVYTTDEDGNVVDEVPTREWTYNKALIRQLEVAAEEKRKRDEQMRDYS